MSFYVFHLFDFIISLKGYCLGLYGHSKFFLIHHDDRTQHFDISFKVPLGYLKFLLLSTLNYKSITYCVTKLFYFSSNLSMSYYFAYSS